jgi:glycosyltransferase involved in cell wall biosynthesis
MQTGRYVHVVHSDPDKMGKQLGASVPSLLNEIKGGIFLKIDSPFSLFKILRETNRGDNLMFHSRATIIESLPFLIFNRITGRNRVACNNYNRLRTVLINKIFMKLFIDKVVCITKDNQQELIKYGLDNTIVIPVPIPVKRIQKYKSDRYDKKYDVVWTGRDVPHKRLGLFLDTVKNIDNLKALVLTPEISPDNKNKLKNMKNVELKEGLDNDDFFKEMTKSKVYVFTSNNDEGFGMVLLEAAYLGIPIIASDINKFREILKEDALFWKDEKDLERMLTTLSKGKLSIPLASKELLEEYSPDHICELYNSW